MSQANQRQQIMAMERRRCEQLERVRKCVLAAAATATEAAIRLVSAMREMAAYSDSGGSGRRRRVGWLGVGGERYF